MISSLQMSHCLPSKLTNKKKQAANMYFWYSTLIATNFTQQLAATPWQPLVEYTFFPPPLLPVVSESLKTLTDLKAGVILHISPCQWTQQVQKSYYLCSTYFSQISWMDPLYSSLVTQFSPVVEVLLFTRAKDLKRVLNSSLCLWMQLGV